MRLIYIVILSFISLSVFSVEIYVSPQGNDRNPGTQSEPKASLHGAIREAREYRRLLKAGKDEPVRIRMAGGTYNLYEPIFIRPEDSGTESSPTIIEAAEGDNVALSGGIRIEGWKKQGKYWVADVPSFNGNRLIFRQLWINGKKAVRARNVSDFEQMDRIRSNDKMNEILWIPASAVKGLTKSENLELVIHQMWAIANLRVKSITVQGDSAGVRFHNPEARIQFEHPWPQPMVKEGFNSAFYFTNAIELLDEPGEWYHDTKTDKIYYMPRQGEDMPVAEAIVPVLESLIEVTGTPDRPVVHICFKNIRFNYTTWVRPSLMGHVPLQAGMYLLDAYKLRPPGVPGNFNKGIENQGWVGRPPAAVMVQSAQNIEFDQCRFEHLGSCGIDFIDRVQKSRINGSLFRDIAGNGIQIGRFSEIGMETHLPYDPVDQREICSHISVSNNYITDVTNEDWGCVGILAGFVQDINIEHNEINEVAYTGISLGWGWTKTVNCMRNNMVHANYIHHYGKHMYDVAGIYTLSVQSKSFITENVVEDIYKPSYVHDPNHWFYLYTDEGSSFITVKDNWCPEEKFLQNANGPGNTWENNGPMVSDSIRQKAGLKPEYTWIKDIK
ncbi:MULTISPECIES: right-handed parallel beta-helix repeat-containing protein [unclassified Dysgonomonas]|uniref:right-handed parallel beta-helix repeat-containing protein n=1 Tax=unclassified Dysgonomonas TaxID=2630389 RepID=UPI0025C36F88|nr:MULTISPECIES: right-handed parallel beta-helix repeat-containing protein [unclassified Dysgonomonas]HMM01386.1 right-handed parallel beta-helix repeat-containing protein [Dysgonomonas sp.]